MLLRHGVDPGRPSVIFVGRITRQKGLSHLLRAARALPAGVHVRVPSVATEGWAENRALLPLLTWKVSVCPDSLAGPLDIEVAHAAE